MEMFLFTFQKLSRTDCCQVSQGLVARKSMDTHMRRYKVLQQYLPESNTGMRSVSENGMEKMCVCVYICIYIYITYTNPMNNSDIPPKNRVL